MNLGNWKSNKSPAMQEIRVALKRKAEKGQPTLPRKEANRTWREDILGIFSEEQKRNQKAQRQKAIRRNTGEE